MEKIALGYWSGTEIWKLVDRVIANEASKMLPSLAYPLARRYFAHKKEKEWQGLA